MKKIFAFIGSPLKENSNTCTLTKMMTDSIIERDKNITCEILTAGHMKINYCKGCWLCMTKGFCPQDKTDDMAILKEKMLEADFIIFGSPVYTMQVSGQMKTFLDRLCCWYHTIRLAGKPGLTVSTTASGGLKEVHDFLYMLMSALGIKVVGKLDTIGFFPKVLKDPVEAKKKALETAELIYPFITGEKPVETDDMLEECFLAMKNKSTFGAEYLPADYEYWKKSGMLEVNSYGELLEKIRNKKRD
jgi:multimeric flavodoxin WrbA